MNSANQNLGMSVLQDLRPRLAGLQFSLFKEKLKATRCHSLHPNGFFLNACS